MGGYSKYINTPLKMQTNPIKMPTMIQCISPPSLTIVTVVVCCWIYG